MADKITENQESDISAFDLPLLIRDKKGKLLTPLSPNWENITKRIIKDEKVFASELKKRAKIRGSLDIEVDEAENINTVLQKAGNIVYQGISGILPTNEDLKDFATYLDWSYQEQVGTPASASNQEEAKKYGVGAFDTWALLTSIKNKLEK